MRRSLGAGAGPPPPQAAPVTDPFRVMLIDPDAVSAAALSRAIDLDREMAVVGLSRDLRRAAADAERCGPDLVAIRLEMDDPRCADLLAELAGVRCRPSVVVLAAAGSPGVGGHDAARLAVRIRAVAEAARSRGTPGAVLLRAEPAVSRLH